MIKTHLGSLGPDRPVIPPATSVRGRQLHQGEITKWGSLGGRTRLVRFTTTSDNLISQPYPYYRINK